MKKHFLVFALFLFMGAGLIHAQVVRDLRIPKEGKLGDFTAWESKTVEFKDGSTAVIEYRIGLAKKVALGCHYDVEVKNNSQMKLDIELKSHYYDKLVKGNFGDKIKGSLKPEKSLTARFIAQGCKKEKGETDDYAACAACDFYVEIFVNK